MKKVRGALGRSLVKREWQLLADLCMFARNDPRMFSDKEPEELIHARDRELFQQVRMLSVGYMGGAPEKKRKK
jgi:hypothetical protein